VTDAETATYTHTYTDSDWEAGGRLSVYSVSNIWTSSEGTTFLAAGMQEISNSAWIVTLKKELPLYSGYILEQMLYSTGTKPQNMKVLI